MTAEQEIKELLKSKGVSAYRLCKDLNISGGLMSSYLSGRYEMTANRYLKIKKYLTK